LAAIVFTAPLLIKLLLSNEFLPATGYIYVASLAVLLKGVAWASGFIIIAKGSKRLFLFVQLAGAVVLLSASFVLYRYYGIFGLGTALLISNIFAVILLYFVVKKQYGFVLSARSYRLLLVFLLLIGLSLSFIWIAGLPDAYFFCGTVFLVSVVISFRGLNRRMDIMSLFKRYFNR
jgi:O-antigen/teichoic acid export membrane protein